MKISEIFKKVASEPSRVPKPFGEGSERTLTYPVEQQNGEVTHDTRIIKTNPSEPGRLQKMDECNCLEVLPSELVDKNLSNEQNSTQSFHRAVLDTIHGMMNEPDDDKRASNVSNYLSKISMKVPTADRDKFKHHLDHHLFNAGLEESYFGLKKEDLGELHKKTQEEAQLTREQSINPPQFHNDNCGVCKQYASGIKAYALKEIEDHKNAIMMGTSSTPEDDHATAAEIVADSIDDYEKGKGSRRPKSPNIAAIRNIMQERDKHMSNVHNESGTISAVRDTRENIPVVALSAEQVEKHGGRNPFVHSLYRKLVQRLSPGWSIERQDTPTGLPPGEFNELYDNLINSEHGIETTPEEEATLRENITIQDRPSSLPNGIPSKTYHIPGKRFNVIHEKAVFREQEGGAGAIMDQRGGTLQTERLPKYIQKYDPTKDIRLKPGADPGTVPDKHKFLFDRAGIKPDSEGLESYRKAKQDYDTQPSHKMVPTGETEEIVEPVFENHSIRHIVKLPPGKQLHDIDIASNPDSLSFEPFDTAYARHAAEREELRERLKKTAPLNPMFWIEKDNKLVTDWKDTHQIVDGSSRGLLIKNLTKSFNDEGKKHLNAKEQGRDDDAQDHINNVTGISKTIDKLKSLQLGVKVPVLDESGKPKTRKTIVHKYDAIPVPKEERIAKPPLSDLVDAQMRYNSSVDTALRKVYPGMSREEAIQTLNKEHEQAIKQSLPMVPRVTAKKGTTVSKKFNSKEKSSAASTINKLYARLGALGCLACGRPKGKAEGKCPGNGSINCRAAVMERRRGDAANSSFSTKD